MLYSISYRSRVAVPEPVFPDTLRAILATARQRNAELDLTGTLVRVGDRFKQVIEGPRPAVEAVMDSIARDPRHRDLTYIMWGPLPRRRFARWSMGYCGAAPQA